MSSSSVLNDSVQHPQMQQKLAGIIQNILQFQTDTSNGIDLFTDLCTPLRDTIRQRTKDEQSRIELFAGHLYLAADYIAKGMHVLLPCSRSSSPDSVDTEPEPTAEGTTTEYDGLAYPERLNGQPSESEFLSSDELVKTEPESTAEGATTEYDEPAYLNEFIFNIRQISDSGRLLVKSTGHKFSVDSLKTLALNKFLSIDIITACLDLFKKLPGVRVGSPISFNYTLRRPLERAAKQMAILDGAETCETCPRQVYLFLLRHCNNGYSLLEVNIRDRYIYHYDPVCTARSTVDVRDACLDQFPTFRYVLKYGIRENDGQNCGLTVIGHALMRMLDHSIVPEEYNLDDVRYHIVDAFNNAWFKGELSVAPMHLLKKRELYQPLDAQSTKRQKH